MLAAQSVISVNGEVGGSSPHSCCPTLINHSSSTPLQKLIEYLQCQYYSSLFDPQQTASTLPSWVRILQEMGYRIVLCIVRQIPFLRTSKFLLPFIYCPSFVGNVPRARFVFAIRVLVAAVNARTLRYVKSPLRPMDKKRYNDK